MAEDDEHRPAFRTYDEFEGRRKKRRRKSGDGEPRKKTREPDATKLTDESLREAALRYLDTQDASVDQVRKVLRRRVYKYGDEESRPAAYDLAEELLRRFVESRILDDERYARGLAESLRRRGSSVAKIRQKMITRGLSDEHMQGALEALEGDEELTDDAAAATYARKRRLKERHDLSDPKQRQKALAALARQGFSFDVARRVLGL